MHRIASTLTFGLLVALTGCPGDDSSPGDTGAASSTGAATEDSTGNPPPGTTGEPETDSADSTGTPDPDTSTGTPPDTSTGPGDSTTDEPGTSGGAGACEPDPADDECGECVKMSCCPEFEACQADTDCTCFTDCAEKNPGIPGAIMCGNTCMVNPLDPATPTGALSACTQNNCAVCLG